MTRFSSKRFARVIEMIIHTNIVWVLLTVAQITHAKNKKNTLSLFLFEQPISFYSLCSVIKVFGRMSQWQLLNFACRRHTNYSRARLSCSSMQDSYINCCSVTPVRHKTFSGHVIFLRRCFTLCPQSLPKTYSFMNLTENRKKSIIPPKL